ncbi:RIP metalloprotease RseP [Candidatus Poribacteria bacterium]|nr:RIP metalloprotease RseP [Candidatus Poribacteria bacterium]
MVQGFRQGNHFRNRLRIMSFINIIWDIIRTLLIVGIIIFVHELGHFLVALMVGIKVEKFSIGFGPKMIGFVRNGIEYKISWLPIFGGYVKMAGENPGDEVSEDEEGNFQNAPVSHRALVAVAGPSMNIIFAITVFALAYMIGLPPEPGTTIGYIEDGSPAEEAGIKPGDKILSISGYKVRKWDDIRENIGINPEKRLDVMLLRDGQEIKTTVVPERVESMIFNMDVNPVNDLNSGKISQSIIQNLKSLDISITPEARVTVVEPGVSWIIKDKNDSYSLRKTQNNLEIYTFSGSQDSQLIAYIPLNIPENLDKGIIPPYLQIKFKEGRASISDKSVVLPQKPGSSWVIKDGDEEFSLEKERDQLIAYQDTDFGKIGISNDIKPIIGEVEPGSPAEKAGFRAGDEIISVNGNNINHIIEFADGIQQSQKDNILLTIKRASGKIEEIKLNLDQQGSPEFLNGIEWLPFTEVVRLNPIYAIGKGFSETGQVVVKVFQFIKRMIVREVPMKYVAGPVGIIQITMAVVKTGFAGILRFAGFLSVNLAIVNLLPLFISDGGVLLFLGIEKIRGKPLERRKQIIIQQIGVAFLISLFLLVTYNDLLRLLKGFF